MKSLLLALSAAVLLAGCNQTAPVSSAPTAAAPETAAPPAAAVRPDSATAAPAPTVATPQPAASAPAEAETLQVSFAFKPVPDPDDPAHPRTSARLVVQGRKPMDIDLGKFTGKPDVVDAAKARAANFPVGMLIGFRSYSAATGTSQDLAVLSVDGHRLRVVQRRVEETAPEAGKFETAREIPLAANTRVVAAPPAKK